MTLLVLGLAVPVFEESSMHREFAQLLEMWPKFASYFVTFLMLGFIWSAHHRQSSIYKRVDSVLIWIRIVYLTFTSLLPFSTSLLGEYMGQRLPLLIYEGDFFLIFLIAYLELLYATAKYRLVDPDIDLYELKVRKLTLLSGVALLVIGMGVSYLNTIASLGMFVVCIIAAIIHTTLRYHVRPTEQVVK
jgi:uncharacterized membrane protein